LQYRPDSGQQGALAKAAKAAGFRDLLVEKKHQQSHQNSDQTVDAGVDKNQMFRAVPGAAQRVAGIVLQSSVIKTSHKESLRGVVKSEFPILW
jgi:hypothetical protein